MKLLILTISILMLSTTVHAEMDSAHYYAKGRKFMELMQQQSYAKVYDGFSEQIKPSLPPEGLGQIWQQLNLQFGKYQGIAEISSRPQTAQHIQNNLYTIAVISLFGETYLDVLLTYDLKTDYLDGLYFLPNTTYISYKTPEWIDESKFTEKELSFGSDEFKLGATLALPKKSGSDKPPVVILIHGSGAHDRDETVFGAKVFRDLAWGLASRGIASFRYEKRTKAYPAKFMGEYDINQEIIEDVLEAIKYLDSCPEIDNKRIILLGHSLGAYILPRIMDKSKSLKAYVLLAGNSRPLEDLIVEQYIYLGSLRSGNDSLVSLQLDMVRRQADNVKSREFGLSANHLLGIPGMFWADLRDYNPSQLASELGKPILVLQGERDYQVTMNDFALWQQALSGKSFATLKSYPDLNHLFVTGQGKSKPGEYYKRGHVDKKVIEDIEKWLKALK